jgi:hypothetical protein
VQDLASQTNLSCSLLRVCFLQIPCLPDSFRTFQYSGRAVANHTPNRLPQPGPRFLNPNGQRKGLAQNLHTASTFPPTAKHQKTSSLPPAFFLALKHLLPICACPQPQKPKRYALFLNSHTRGSQPHNLRRTPTPFACLLAGWLATSLPPPPQPALSQLLDLSKPFHVLTASLPQLSYFIQP